MRSRFVDAARRADGGVVASPWAGRDLVGALGVRSARELAARLESLEADDRSHAMWLLSVLKRPGAVPILVRLAGSPDTTMVLDVVHGLLPHANLPAVRQALLRATYHLDATVRAGAVYVLCATRNAPQRRFLRMAEDAAEDTMVRAQAMEALGNQTSRCRPGAAYFRHFWACVDRLLAGPDAELRLWALYSGTMAARTAPAPRIGRLADAAERLCDDHRPTSMGWPVCIEAQWSLGALGRRDKIELRPGLRCPNCPRTVPERRAAPD